MDLDKWYYIRLNDGTVTQARFSGDDMVTSKRKRLAPEDVEIIREVQPIDNLVQSFRL